MLTKSRVMSPRELGDIVGLSAAKIRELIREGNLEHIPIGRTRKYVTLDNWEKFCLRSGTHYKKKPGAISRLNFHEGHNL